MGFAPATVLSVNAGSGMTDRKRRPLSARDLVAADAVAVGANDQEAADQSGLHRVTVSNLRRKNSQFQARVNERRAEIWQGSLDLARSALSGALRALVHRVEQGDDEAITQVLKLLGRGVVDGLKPVGPTQPIDIENALVIARQGRQSIEAFISDGDRIAALSELYEEKEEEQDDNR
jgi:hypothetical protein